MPDQNDALQDDPNVETHYVLQGGKRVAFKLRNVPYEEFQRRKAAAEFDALTAADLNPPTEPETVDVAEVRREVRKREKAEGT